MSWSLQKKKEGILLYRLLLLCTVLSDGTFFKIRV